jgi:hypothetical protein
MQPTAPKPRRSSRGRALRRYLPVVAVVVVIAVVAAVVATTGGGGKKMPSSVSAAARNGEPPLFSRAAKVGWGPNCDTRTGRVKVPLSYAPPCVPPFHGNNGGATANGVTGDTITVAVYEQQPDVLQQVFFERSGADETVKAEEATQQAYVNFFESHYEMYGRKVKLVFVKASGSDDDDAAAKADAIKVATQIHAFASWGGPEMTSAYADELAAHGVLCVGDCTLAQPQSFVDQRAPYIWPTEPSFEQAAVHWAEFISKEVAGRKATHAGDPAMRKETRKFGLIRYDDDSGTFAASAAHFRSLLAKSHIKLAADVAYPFDLTTAQETARTVISQMKAAGVTSVILGADPVMPSYFTAEATRQGYFPEWIVLGTVYTDTTLFGRTYDQKQWAHAFGVSLLPARTDEANDQLAQIITWQTGHPPVAKTYAELVQSPLIFFTGVHLAGPHLTAQTFRDGLFRYPSGTTHPTLLHVSWGRHGIWPATDYFGGDDATLIWWNPDATGPDEVGNQGKGMYEYAHDGQRYLPGQWPRGDADVFDPSGSLTLFNTLPPSDRPPSYPSPAG